MVGATRPAASPTKHTRQLKLPQKRKAVTQRATASQNRSWRCRTPRMDAQVSRRPWMAESDLSQEGERRLPRSGKAKHCFARSERRELRERPDPERSEGPHTINNRGVSPQKEKPYPNGYGFSNKILAVSYSHMGRPHTTIGAERFHFRVRNGIGWFPLAIAARKTVEGKSGVEPQFSTAAGILHHYSFLKTAVRPQFSPRITTIWTISDVASSH